MTGVYQKSPGQRPLAFFFATKDQAILTGAGFRTQIFILSILLVSRSFALIRDKRLVDHLLNLPSKQDQIRMGRDHYAGMLRVIQAILPADEPTDELDKNIRVR